MPGFSIVSCACCGFLSSTETHACRSILPMRDLTCFTAINNQFTTRTRLQFVFWIFSGLTKTACPDTGVLLLLLHLSSVRGEVLKYRHFYWKLLDNEAIDKIWIAEKWCDSSFPLHIHNNKEVYCPFTNIHSPCS
jgi:hypothetical protein